uniref:Uncharacterized protein n=1 Tax=Ananas comosus var. bracteatus TaxID=296719 RepID=A0A6V7Q024_ANACO|nr:unnamed protein product [Ananas comosus var. bracteatus]
MLITTTTITSTIYSSGCYRIGALGVRVRVLVGGELDLVDEGLGKEKRRWMRGLAGLLGSRDSWATGEKGRERGKRMRRARAWSRMGTTEGQPPPPPPPRESSGESSTQDDMKCQVECQSRIAWLNAHPIATPSFSFVNCTHHHTSSSTSRPSDGLKRTPYPSLRVAYVDEVEETSKDRSKKIKKVYYSALVKAATSTKTDESSKTIQNLDQIVHDDSWDKKDNELQAPLFPQFRCSPTGTGTQHQTAQTREHFSFVIPLGYRYSSQVPILNAEILHITDFSARTPLSHYTESVLRSIRAKTTSTCPDTLQTCRQATDAEVSQTIKPQGHYTQPYN